MKKVTAAMISIMLLCMFCAGLSAAETMDEKTRTEFYTLQEETE